MTAPDQSHAACLHLTKLGSKKLSEFIAREGPLVIPDRYSDDPLMGLCQIIVGQQVSNQAARAIWARVCTYYPDRSARIDALAAGQTSELGLSRAKQRTLTELLNHGESWLCALMDTSETERFRQLTALWGIGPWSVAMWELFVLKNPDIWSDGDLILKRISETLALEADQPRAAWIEQAAPFRSFLALYCWKLNDA
jgi:3-methyladenine DNA glycosylase/8-oxoguanine DNA glycosylase